MSLGEQEGAVAGNLKVLFSANLVRRLHLFAGDALKHLTDNSDEEVDKHDDHETHVDEPDDPNQVDEGGSDDLFAGIEASLPVQVMRHIKVTDRVSD